MIRFVVDGLEEVEDKITRWELIKREEFTRRKRPSELTTVHKDYRRA
jgi:hypothetical protein